ncbi:NUDIX hydrolase [Haloechinothrix alba]|uniref:NUDIX hydrolase n=1 Tax=Haloechinothrix alba TaxID=664784 RepID=UPI000B77B430|nr:NUDIX hydrolase [Haloechinothrix alba]
MTVLLLVLVCLLVVTLVVGGMLVSAANRLDRLHVRTDAGWAALKAALDRRAVVARAVAVGMVDPDSACRADRADTAAELRAAADRAERAGRAEREIRESELTRLLAAVDTSALPPDLAGELSDAEQRVVIARRVYNDAVRDTLSVRRLPAVRYFRLAGSAPAPDYFEIAEPGPRADR